MVRKSLIGPSSRPSSGSVGTPWPSTRIRSTNTALLGATNLVKRFVPRTRIREPAQFDRLSFLPGEEMQVDYGEGAPTRLPGTEHYRKPRLFVDTLRTPAQLPPRGLAIGPASLGGAARTGLAPLRRLVPLRGAGEQVSGLAHSRIRASCTTAPCSSSRARATDLKEAAARLAITSGPA